MLTALHCLFRLAGEVGLAADQIRPATASKSAHRSGSHSGNDDRRSYSAKRHKTYRR